MKLHGIVTRATPNLVHGRINRRMSVMTATRIPRAYIGEFICLITCRCFGSRCSRTPLSRYLAFSSASGRVSVCANKSSALGVTSVTESRPSIASFANVRGDELLRKPRPVHFSRKLEDIRALADSRFPLIGKSRHPAWTGPRSTSVLSTSTPIIDSYRFCCRRVRNQACRITARLFRIMLTLCWFASTIPVSDTSAKYKANRFRFGKKA